MASVSSTSPAPTPQEVRQITAIEDPVIRNLRITECYHRLSAAISARIGSCANWCTFATWASRQAGRTIRGEDLLERLAAQARTGWTFLHPIRSLWRILLRRGLFYPETRLGRLVKEIHSPFDAFERASASVGRGNLKVFEEIGFEFARYLEQCRVDSSVDSPEFNAFVRSLRAGDPPEGQDYLRKAFLRYQQAIGAGSASGRAQRIFLANLEIGLHEQTRLQPEIQAAMEAVPDTVEDLGGRILPLLFPITRRLVRFLRRMLASLLGIPGRSLQRFLREATRRAVTESLMVLTLPGGLIIALSKHLDRPFPKDLVTLDDAELALLLKRFEPEGGADSCGAEDWADLKQRMHFVAHLFRAFHERAELFDPPFTPEQVKACLSGVVPRGEL
jgi:hypothetical protein